VHETRVRYLAKPVSRDGLARRLDGIAEASVAFVGEAEREERIPMGLFDTLPLGEDLVG